MNCCTSLLVNFYRLCCRCWPVVWLWRIVNCYCAVMLLIMACWYIWWHCYMLRCMVWLSDCCFVCIVMQCVCCSLAEAMCMVDARRLHEQDVVVCAAGLMNAAATCSPSSWCCCWWFDDEPKLQHEGSWKSVVCRVMGWRTRQGETFGTQVMVTWWRLVQGKL